MDSKELEAELAKAQEGEGGFRLDHDLQAEQMLMRRDAEIEPFDAKLAQRIQALSAQIENQTLELANLRRTAPAASSQRFQHSFTKLSEQDDARLRRDEERQLEEAKQAHVEVAEVERLDEIQATWQNGSENLMSLKSGLGGTVAKMERAQRAADILEQR